VAQDIRDQDKSLEDEERTIRAHLDQIKEKRTNLAQCDIRLQSYPPAGSKFPCPRCFVLNGDPVEMKPIDSDNKADIFKCPHCILELEFEELRRRKMDRSVDALFVKAFQVDNSTDGQVVVLHFVCEKQEFDFFLTLDGADNLRAGLDKAVSLIQHQSGHPKH